MPFRFDKLTTKAQALVAEAQARANSAGNPEITPLHLLAAMLEEGDGITRPLMEKMKVDALRTVFHVVSGNAGELRLLGPGHDDGGALMPVSGESLPLHRPAQFAELRRLAALGQLTQAVAFFGLARGKQAEFDDMVVENLVAAPALDEDTAPVQAAEGVAI